MSKLYQDRNGAIESFSKGLEILQDFKVKSAYRHPLSDLIQGYISQLHTEK
jgi:hypothetical protein